MEGMGRGVGKESFALSTAQPFYSPYPPHLLESVCIERERVARSQFLSSYHVCIVSLPLSP